MKADRKTPAGRDRPWIFRTYSGHSTATESNRLYRANLARGQTGLSIAFDLPTQTGYDPDHELARGEVGKVGVSIAHLGDMRALFEQIPLGEMNTSMTINATAAWLLALYVVVAEEGGISRQVLAGTTQNDIIKEYLARGTYVFPPAPSMRLIQDVVLFTTREMPRWNPTNICSYHLQEAGATPQQELAFALATAIAVLDAIRASGEVGDSEFAEVVGRISFFVNAGMRFITEMCKMRAFAELWDEICLERYGITDPKKRLFRYGVQVNSLGLTEQQPENNIARILIEMLAVTLSKHARARAVQLPAWNEALGLPKPWDQQWSLRLQQILAYETDLLDHDDLFDGSPVVAARVAALKEAVLAELATIEAQGGAVACVANGTMKAALVRANAERLAAIESGRQAVVGVNCYVDAEPSPLVAGTQAILTVPEEVEFEAIARLRQWRAARDGGAVAAALAALEAAAREGRNIMEPSIACARAGVTIGEWGETLRGVFGEFRAPTGVTLADDPEAAELAELRDLVHAMEKRLGAPMTLLVGKPGLDGHSNGAEQIAARAGASGMRVIYDGIRQTPAEIVAKAKIEKPHVIGLSILSGSHVPLVRAVMNGLRREGLDIPVVVGGIIPPDDAHVLRNIGVSGVYTPKDFRINAVLADVIGLAGRAKA